MPLIEDVLENISLAELLDRLKKLETQATVNADNIKTLFGVEDDEQGR